MNRLFDWLRTRPAVVASVFAIVVNLQGVWLPSFWYDEVFTLYAISRPLDELLLLTTTQVDAVHLAYYLFMWFWTSVFGLSELAVRLPSVIAAAAGTFFTALVAKRLFGRDSIALAAGIAFAMLPATVMMTTWARSYALQAAVFAALLWAFVRLIENLKVVHSPRQRTWDYVLLGALLTMLIYLNIYGVLLIPVFAAVVVLLYRPVRMGALLQLTIALAVPLILSIPLLSLAVQQRGQIDWTGRPGLESIFFDQLFVTNVLAAIIGWSLMVAAVSYSLQRQSSAEHRKAVFLLVVSFAFPTLVVVALSWNRLLGQSLYNTKYFYFASPALAVLMGLGVHILLRHTSRRARIATALVVAVLIVPSLERTTKGRDGDWLAGIEATTSAANAGANAGAGYWLANDHTSSLVYVYRDRLSSLTDLTRTDEPDSGLITDVVPLAEAIYRAREMQIDLFVGYRIVNQGKIQSELSSLGVTEFEEIHSDGRFEVLLVE